MSSQVPESPPPSQTQTPSQTPNQSQTQTPTQTHSQNQTHARTQTLEGSGAMADLCQPAPAGLLSEALPPETVGADLLFRLGPPERLPSLEPLLIDGIHAEVWENSRSAAPDTFSSTGPAPWLACLEDATVLTWMMFVANRSGRLVQEYFLNRPRLFNNISPEFPRTGHFDQPITREVTEEVVLLGGPWCGAFYHWMNDFLPRLRMLLPELEGRAGGPLKFLTLEPGHFQRETLKKAGISFDQLMPFDRTAWRFRRLWVPSQVGHHMSTTPSNLRWLRRVLGSPSPAAQSASSLQPPEKIYLSRRDTDRRRVTNEEALERLLHQRGFVTIDGSQGTVEQQLQLFSRARVVVAPHGGGLTHLSFAPPGTLVIELMPLSHVTFPFYNIARCAGHSYIFLLSEPVNDQADFEADLGVLELVLG